jgi:ankyrin repeat protein
MEDARRLLPNANHEDRHLALSIASDRGHVDVVRLLLDAGEDPNRYNPVGGHSHTTPLHQAAGAGHEEVVRLLVERGARLDLKDILWHGLQPIGQDTAARRPLKRTFARKKLHTDSGIGVFIGKFVVPALENRSTIPAPEKPNRTSRSDPRKTERGTSLEFLRRNRDSKSL